MIWVSYSLILARILSKLVSILISHTKWRSIALFVDLLAVAEELELLLAGLDGRATELGDQDTVTDGDTHG